MCEQKIVDHADGSGQVLNEFPMQQGKDSRGPVVQPESGGATSPRVCRHQKRGGEDLGKMTSSKS